MWKADHRVPEETEKQKLFLSTINEPNKATAELGIDIWDTQCARVARDYRPLETRALVAKTLAPTRKIAGNNEAKAFTGILEEFGIEST